MTTIPDSLAGVRATPAHSTRKWFLIAGTALLLAAIWQRPMLTARFLGRGASLRGVDLSYAPLAGADLRGADLRGAFLNHTSLTSADLRDADMRGAFLKFTRLRGAVLATADLRGAYIVAHFEHVELSGADLTGATIGDGDKSRHFTQVNLNDATLVRADLRGALMTLVTLKRADLRLADLSRANFGSVDLTDANLDGAILRGLRYNAETRWPKGFDPRTRGAIPDLTPERAPATR